MATNRKFDSGRYLNVVPTDPASGGASGDPCVLGKLPGVMQTKQRAAATGTELINSVTIDTKGVYNLSVKGVVTGTGNAAIAAGDIVYYNSGDTPKLNVTTTGVAFGIALSAVTSGSTATIAVRLG